IDPSSRLCTLMFNRIEEGTEWILGTSFLRPFCLSIDYSANAISFAQVRSA
ncbi:hypothetical protein AAVH_43622, partial [Aphelenchoides avenae]